MSWPTAGGGVSIAKDGNGNVLGIGQPLSILGAKFSNAKLLRKSGASLRNGLNAQVALASGAFISYLRELTTPEVGVSAVRFYVPNSHPTASPQVRINFGFSEVAGDPTLPLNTLTVGGVASTSGWSNATLNGATANSGAFNLLADPLSTTVKPFYTITDWMIGNSLPRTDAGRTRQIMKVITEYGGYENGVAAATTITLQTASAGITGWEQDTDITVPPYGRINRTRSQAVAAGVDASTLTSTTADNSATNYHSPVIVEMLLANGFVRQYILLGDSEVEGTGDSPDKMGHLHRALFKLSTPSAPIEVINAAQAGTTMSAWRTVAENLIPQFPGSTVVVPNFSPNVTMPPANYVAGATVVSAGSGGTPGAVTLTGTTGVGTVFQATGTIAADGTLSAITGITVPGNYTTLPTVTQAEPVTGGGLTGAVLNLKVLGAPLIISKRDIAQIKAICDQYDCAMVMLTCMPSNTSGRDYKGGDPVRAGLNTLTMANGELVIDTSTFVSGGTVGNQVQMVPAYTTDNLHLNPTGHNAVEVNVTTPYLSKITG